MCTYTSVSSGSGSGGGGGGGSGGYGVDSLYSNKRTRKQKVPKRGPGVAELEKILREQEKKKNIGLHHHKTNTNHDHHEGFSLEVSQLSSSSSYHAQSPPPPVLPSLPKKVPFATDPNRFSPPRNNNTSLAGSFCRSSGNGSGGSNILVLPEHTFNSPTTWNSYDPPNKVIDIGGPRFASAGIPFSMLSSNGPSPIFPSPTLAQRSQFSPTSLISNFPQLPVASSSCSTLIPSSAGMCPRIEPPSNQTSCHHHHYTSILPEEDKMVCRKRSCPFSMEIPPTPFHYQVPTFSPQGSRQDSSFPPGSHKPVNNLERIEAVSRELKVDCKCDIVDYGEANSNFLLFGSPTFPSPASSHISRRDQRSKFNHPPSFQENMEESLLHRAGTGKGSICNKPFFSFLVPLEQMSKVETTYNLNNNRVEARGDGIDLDLRL